ncbi:hypothetical protein MCOR27_002952 [Pyricularia oryzae]|uniref:Uncharacterized protein n=2 Tax=Pyricularia TaxID=48558 RepID=A0ABQ8NCU3_PYRGI|nr:hypothetical protein MCOR01_001093 [Pyricularia oryzae]KAI6295003.1 hypothetical protein MCOR33_008006 [Pyricularia grisea]KAH9430384.1 hypothetical protein MCOR02_010090 [Pyricularia oryzae]KAI6256890.1 hypothetical protein MCOR19_006648 [Pyricularia oryzae]KAI6275664.1 hypothetical protein MCOR26_005918 [Pyricularia oryzae]
MVRHLLSLGAALGLLASATMAKEMPVNEEMAAIWYDSGLAHEESMHHKSELWRMEREMGLMDSENYPELGYHACTNGWIEAIPGDRMHTFRCDQMDLHHFLSHGALNSTGQGSGTWGWISDDGREFAAIGQEDGAAFVEIKDGKLVLVARLPQPPTALVSNWREMKSYKNYMVIGSEAVAHGIQIFDMTKLLDIDVEATGPVVFDPIADLSGYTNDLPIGRSHNVVVNEERDYMVAVGSQPRNDSCRAGLIFFDITDVANPVRQGCAADDGYVHDAHCLVYRGPDKRYDGKDICYGYNEDSLTIYDVSDKTTTNIISRTSYEGVNYTHQGWVTDVNNQEFLLMNDERDERYRAGPASDGFPVVYVWDIRDLEKPKQTGTYKYPTRAIDHNLYIKDGIMFQSNYGNGYQLMDVSSVGPSDTTGSGICRAAFIDIYPEDDNVAGGGIIEFVGTWSSWGWYPSGYHVVNTIERGVFLVKPTSLKCPPAPTCNADNCLRAMRAESVQGRLEESQEFCAAYTANLVTEVSVLPEYATKACTGDAISRVSSACACIPTVAPAN